LFPPKESSSGFYNLFKNKATIFPNRLVANYFRKGKIVLLKYLFDGGNYEKDHFNK